MNSMTAGGQSVEDQTDFRAIVFTDVENSTALQGRRGDDAARRIVRTSEDLSAVAVERHGGEVVKHTGDGLLAVFGSTRHAVLASLEAMELVREHSRSNPEEAVRIRVGIHAGEVIDETSDVHGSAVTAAARICDIADGGEILVSELVRTLCEGQNGLAFSPKGRFELKGFEHRWPILAVYPDASEAGEGHQTTYVGRRGHIAEIRNLIEKASDGRGSVAFVSGEAGVGKSRFVLEIERIARQRGMLVSKGHCYSTANDVPYGPWVNLIEAALDELDDDAVRLLLGEQASALAQLVPMIRRRLPDIPDPIEIPGDQQRSHLLNALRALMVNAVRRRPLLMIIEDLHWGDEPSISVFEQVASWLDEVPVVVVGTHRNARTEGTPALRSVLGTLARRQNCEIAQLEPLDEDEVTEMLSHLSGSVPPRAVADAFVEITGGNTFFVEEMFRHLTDSDQLLDRAGNFLPIDFTTAEIPATVMLVIDQQMQTLAPVARQLLDKASVFGGPIPEQVLSEIADMDSATLLDAVDAVMNAQFLVEERALGGSYRFRHELVRHAVSDELSDLRRAAYHESAATALERVFPERQAELAANVVGHLLQAGSRIDPHRLRRWLLLAGRRALDTAAHQDAERYLNHAESLHPHPDEPRARLLVELGTAQLSLGHWDEAVVTWGQALELYEVLGDPEAGALVCTDLARQLIWSYRFTEMAQIASRGLAMLGDAESVQRPKLTAMLGLAASLSGESERAQGLIESAVELAEQSGDDAARGLVRILETVHHYFHMEFPETTVAGRHAVSLQREVGDQWTLVDAQAFLDVGLVYSGSFEESTKVRSELGPMSHRIGHHGAATIAGRNAFVASAATTGDLDELDALVSDQLAVAGATGNLAWLGTAWTLAGIASFWRGQWTRAERSLADAVGAASPFWVGSLHALTTLVHAYRQQRSEVERRLEQSHEFLAIPDRRNLVGSWTASIFAAEAASLVDLEDHALSLYPVVVDALGTGAVTRQLDGRLIETVAGMAACAAGLIVESDQHFEKALVQADELPHRIEQPHVRHFFGHSLLKRDNGKAGSERGRQLIIEAAKMYESIGMHRHAALASDVLTNRGA